MTNTVSHSTGGGNLALHCCGARPESLDLGVIQTRMENSFHPTPPDHGGQTQADIFHAEKTIHDHADGHGVFGVECDGLNDGRGSQRNAVVGVTFVIVNLDAGTDDALDEFATRGRVVNRFAASSGATHRGELRAAMLAKNVRSQIIAMNRQLQRKLMTQARGINQRTTADDGIWADGQRGKGEREKR